MKRERIIEILRKNISGYQLARDDDPIEISGIEMAADEILALPIESVSDSWISMKVRQKKGSLSIMTKEELIGYELGFRAGRDEIIRRELPNH